MSNNGQEKAISMLIKSVLQERMEKLSKLIGDQVHSALEEHGKGLMKLIIFQQYQIATLGAAMEELIGIMIDKGVLTQEECDQLLKHLESKDEDREDDSSGDDEERVYGSTNTSSSQSD